MTELATLQRQLESIDSVDSEPAIEMLTAIIEEMPANHIHPNSVIENVKVEYIDDAGETTHHTQEMSLLMVAMMLGQTKLAKRLIAAGADINQVVSPENHTLGHSALTVAIYCGQIDSALWLLDKGARVTLTDNAGNTPLHKLASLSHSLYMTNLCDIPLLLQELLRQGVDPSVKNHEGKTAHTISITNEYALISDAISKHLLREQVSQKVVVSTCAFHAKPSNIDMGHENTAPTFVP